MARLFLRLLLALCIAGSCYVAKEPGSLTEARAWIKDVLDQQSKSFNPAELENTALAALDETRKAKQQPPLHHDGDLHQFIADKLKQAANTPLPELLESLQKSRPNYARVAGISAQSLSASGLKDGIMQWRDGNERFYTQVAAVAKPGVPLLGGNTLLVVAEQLPTLTPEAVNNTTATTFFSVCAHCGKGAQCEITHHNYTLSLECPQCRHINMILAADLSGQMHYANEFLTGWAPPAHFPKGCSKLDEMLIIWRAVGDICHYKKDSEDVVNDPEDAWQFALETQKLGTGDCEDSAIMLTDWLCSRGFEARVALGRYAGRGSHAWVVVNLEGKVYLLESTMPDNRSDHLPLASQVGSRYVPEAMLDYHSIYVRRDPKAIWDGGYFTEKDWLHFVPRDRPPLAAELAGTNLRSCITHVTNTAAHP